MRSFLSKYKLVFIVVGVIIVVGMVMGIYHPHGYEAIVRMSQPWKNEAPLIEML